MGITNFDLGLLAKVIPGKSIKTVLELGDQFLYIHGEDYGKYADKYYKERGIVYECLDLNGNNNALVMDLAEPFDLGRQFDLITDFGTSEHVDSAYHSFENIHRMAKTGGWIIHEHPKTGHWPGHGHHYFTLNFFFKLCQLAGYTLMESGENPAMGNYTDGWEIWAIMRKETDGDFISEEQFNTLDLHKI